MRPDRLREVCPCVLRLVMLLGQLGLLKYYWAYSFSRLNRGPKGGNRKN